MAPVAPRTFGLYVTIDQETHDSLLYAKALLSHEIPSGDMAEVLRKLARIGIEALEKRKFAQTSKPRSGHSSANPRHIPAQVKRAVLERDGSQCTFVSDQGRRCESRARLEFDHTVPVARGGQATVDNIRIRCRAHNQHGAEQIYGAEFMRQKREQAKRAAAARLAARVHGPEDRDVILWLRQLGYRAEQARRAAAHCERMLDATLEQRVRAALAFLAPPHRKVAAPA